MSISSPSSDSTGFLARPTPPPSKSSTPSFELREIPMDLLVVMADQLGDVADAVGLARRDGFEQFEVLLAQKPTQIGVRTDIEHGLGVVEVVARFGGLDPTAGALVEPVALAVGYCERWHGGFLRASYGDRGQSHDTGVGSSASRVKRS